MPASSFAPFDAVELFRQWLPVPSGAAGSFTQPILPGWTLNINSHNSSAPATEAKVVAEHSYGRQIGRISDALRALIVDAHGATPARAEFADFLALWDDVERLKTDEAAVRLERVVADLGRLRAERPADYERVRDGLLQALGAPRRQP